MKNTFIENITTDLETMYNYAIRSFAENIHWINYINEQSDVFTATVEDIEEAADVLDAVHDEIGEIFKTFLERLYYLKTVCPEFDCRLYDEYLSNIDDMHSAIVMALNDAFDLID